MSNLFQELKRRNVFRVAIAYAAIAWLILQISDIVLENIGAPAWVMQTLMFLLAIGFPIAVLFAWAYEMTPEGHQARKRRGPFAIDHAADRTETESHDHRRVACCRWLPAGRQVHAGKARAPEVTAAGDRSVAVLPFVAMSSGGER